MTSAIGAPTSTGFVDNAPAQRAGGPDADLEKYKRQVADCENCASASTPAGRAKIADLSAKISAIDQKVKAAAASEPAAPTTAGADSLGYRLNVYA